ncbi:hypothetical protein ACHOLT_17150 [Desulfitobacterium sp. Sab5]|uniref:hypothetical protein n=1 Tax=Desulfitobacterium nosdiversum TaxID=3375356 RepID=UPI003CF57D10
MPHANRIHPPQERTVLPKACSKELNRITENKLYNVTVKLGSEPAGEDPGWEAPNRYSAQALKCMAACFHDL